MEDTFLNAIIIEEAVSISIVLHRGQVLMTNGVKLQVKMDWLVSLGHQK